MEVERKVAIIPFGPLHPATKEPVNLVLFVEGEEVVGAEFRFGYVYRAIEVLAERRNLVQVLHLTERICGICSHAHPLCYVQSVESIAGIEPPERALYIRTILAELERIQNHLLWLGVLGYQLGFLALFMYAWRIREAAMDAMEALTGGRVMKAANAIGGARCDVSEKAAAMIRSAIKESRKAAEYLFDVIHDKTVEARLQGVGVLSRSDAVRCGAVGPTARASGVKSDVRVDDPYAAYEQLKGSFSVVTSSGCDSLARAEVRVAEILESANILEAALDTLPPGDPRPKIPPHRVLRVVPRGESVARVEAPRGELLYYAVTDGNGFLSRLKIRTPTLANLVALAEMLKGAELADVPAIYASIDPCIACTERALVVDVRSGVKREIELSGGGFACSP